MVIVISTVATLICFITPDVVQHLFLKNYSNLSSFIDSLPASLQSVGDELLNFLRETTYIGVILLCVAVLFLVNLAISALLMRKKVFLKVCIYFFQLTFFFSRQLPLLGL